MAGAVSLTEQNESPNENTQRRRALHPPPPPPGTRERFPWKPALRSDTARGDVLSEGCRWKTNREIRTGFNLNGAVGGVRVIFGDNQEKNYGNTIGRTFQRTNFHILKSQPACVADTHPRSRNSITLSFLILIFRRRCYWRAKG